MSNNFGRFLSRLKPFFLKWASSKEDTLKIAREKLEDPYLSGMVKQFGTLHQLIFNPYFSKVRIDPNDLTKLKDLSQTGTLVYVMKNRGQLEYSYFNHLFLKENIPLARFANRSRTLFWRPLRDIVLILIAKLEAFYSHGFLPDPVSGGFLQECIRTGQSVLLNLKVSRDFLFGDGDESLSFIPPLLQGVAQSERPVYLITQQFLHATRPETDKKSWFDLLFGDLSNPGTFRKLILFLARYRKKALVRFGEPLLLNDWVAAHQQNNLIEQTQKMKELLFLRLEIERKSITGPKLKSPAWFWQKIRQDNSFNQAIKNLALETKRSETALEQEAQKNFKEIAAQVNYTAIEIYNRFVTWLSNTMYDGIEIDQEGLKKIKAVMGKHPVVLVPCHKSHVDYLLISHLFYINDLSLPHICAGINLNFWPVGKLLRKGGAFFIRRSFAGASLYRTVLFQYLKVLINQGYCIEFFIEGTRSRTGKLLKPRMGILSMLIDAWLEGASPDILFVPVSVNYERIPEQKSYVHEIKGGEKNPENVAEMLKASQKIRKKYGRVSLQFAEPISLATFLNEKGITPHTQQNTHIIRQEVSEFAYKITYNINKVSEITSTSLVAMAMLSFDKKGIPEKAIFQRASLFKRYLEFKGARLSGVIRQNEERAYREALTKLQQEKLTVLHTDFFEKFYTLSEAARVTLDYHKNNSLHFFVSLTCFLKILDIQVTSSNKSGVLLSDIEKIFESLKTLLRHDFTFSERATLREHLLKVIEFCVKEGIIAFDIQTEQITYTQGSASHLLKIYSHLLDNFFESYRLTLLYIWHVSFEKIEKKKLISSILEKGRALYMKGDLHFIEGISQFNIESALQVFTDVGLIKTEQKLLTRQLDENTIKKWNDLLNKLLNKY